MSISKKYQKNIREAAALFLLLSGMGLAEASDAGYPPVNFPVLPSTEWRRDSLHLEFTASLGRKLKSSESVTIRPMYIVAKDTLRFRTLTFASPSEVDYRKRRESLQHVAPDGVVFEQGKKHLLSAEYSSTERTGYYGQGRLILVTELHNCCDPVQRDFREVYVGRDPRFDPCLDPCAENVTGSGGNGVLSGVADSRFLAEEMPAAKLEMPGNRVPEPRMINRLPLFEGNVTLFRPVEEQVKVRNGRAVARLEFPVARWAVLSDFRGNARELSRLDSLMAPVASDKDMYSVKSVNILAYASPEDTWHNNLELSRKRAASVRNYVVNRHGLDPAIVASDGKGEDWDGLRKAVAASAKPWKERVLAIIDGYGIHKGREKVLMDLQGGLPYKEMLREMFPALRRMEMEIEYEVRPYRDEELAAVLESRPSDMSMREMWRIAKETNSDALISRDRENYGGEYYLMARYFPDNMVANINASSAALIRGDLESAWKYLSKVADSPMAANNLGLYYYLCGREEEARAYLNMARAVDPVRAEANIRLLDSRK